MKCPYCSFEESKVIDSRPTDEGHTIRRRRECISCKKRFTTYEKIEEVQLVVIKKDGTRESFNRNKLINGLIRACEKRPVSLKQIESVVESIEIGFQNDMLQEVESSIIGELIMRELRDLDEVAYVRFASVYRQFKDLDTFMDELTRLLNEKRHEK
jgi:transcriptional repressor NrdR